MNSRSDGLIASMHNREGKRYGDREIEHSRAEQRRAEKTWKGRLDMAGQGGQGMRVGDAIELRRVEWSVCE